MGSVNWAGNFKSDTLVACRRRQTYPTEKVQVVNVCPLADQEVCRWIGQRVRRDFVRVRSRRVLVTKKRIVDDSNLFVVSTITNLSLSLCLSFFLYVTIFPRLHYIYIYHPLSHGHLSCSLTPTLVCTLFRNHVSELSQIPPRPWDLFWFPCGDELCRGGHCHANLHIHHKDVITTTFGSRAGRRQPCAVTLFNIDNDGPFSLSRIVAFYLVDVSHHVGKASTVPNQRDRHGNRG